MCKRNCGSANISCYYMASRGAGHSQLTQRAPAEGLREWGLEGHPNRHCHPRLPVQLPEAPVGSQPAVLPLLQGLPPAADHVQLRDDGRGGHHPVQLRDSARVCAVPGDVRDWAGQALLADWRGRLLPAWHFLPRRAGFCLPGLSSRHLLADLWQLLHTLSCWHFQAEHLTDCWDPYIHDQWGA